MGHFSFRSIIVSIICTIVRSQRSPMITVASQEKPLRVIYDPRGSQSVNDRIDLARKPDI